jgi:hypothetical protein
MTFKHLMMLVESEGFSRWCTTLRIIVFIDFVHRQELVCKNSQTMSKVHKSSKSEIFFDMY